MHPLLSRFLHQDEKYGVIVRKGQDILWKSPIETPWQILEDSEKVWESQVQFFQGGLIISNFVYASKAKDRETCACKNALKPFP